MNWTTNLSNSVLAVDGITMIVGLPSNLLALYIFIQKVRQRATPIHVLLLSLTISDLIFLFFLPLRMKEAADMKWTMSDFLCPLSGFIFYATIYNSTLLLMSISVERYLGVAFPIKHKLKQHPRYAVIACVIFWAVSMAHCSVVYIVQFQKGNPEFNQSIEQCYRYFTDKQLTILLSVRFELFVVLFFIPFIICTFCYIRFILILYRLPSIKPQKRFRAIRLAIATLLVFIICFMPYNVSHVVGFIGRYDPEWRGYALLTSTFNACLDPLVFYFSSSAIRSTCKNLKGKLISSIQAFGRLLTCSALNTTHKSNSRSL